MRAIDAQVHRGVRADRLFFPLDSADAVFIAAVAPTRRVDDFPDFSYVYPTAEMTRHGFTHAGIGRGSGDE
ncbi:hypothetical protein CVUC_11255 [Caulobacter vibrioides]|nr:hypothetical protein CA608_02330 [Caulobacter vibrioides]PLR11962.1 hypothetical protein CVUC_11255 [Caulobacter vibrioides]